jgi:hypothetical protein
LERIGLLGESKLRCPSVIKVEGLRSYKAIAFTKSGSNPRTTRLKAKTYSTLRTSLKKTIFSKSFIVLFRNITRYSFNEKLGDEEWRK